VRESYLYLAGQISGISYKEATIWREYVKEKLPRNIRTLSPMRGQEWLSGELSLSWDYEGYPLTSAAGLLARSFFDVQRSDMVLTDLSAASTVSQGTLCEMGWAYALRKPIILVMDKGDIHDTPIVAEQASLILPDLDTALSVVKTMLAE